MYQFLRQFCILYTARTELIILFKLLAGLALLTKLNSLRIYKGERESPVSCSFFVLLRLQKMDLSHIGNI